MNYYIKQNYKPNKKINTIDTKEKKYWKYGRASRSYYTRYYLFLNLKKLIRKKQLKSVLDIGCGPAVKLMRIIAPICQSVYGIDQENIVNYNIKHYNSKTFFVDNIEKATLDLKRKFDLIICTDVIEHLLDPDYLIEYIKKNCHENTYICITTPERDILRGKECNFSPHPYYIREWNKEEFQNYLKHHNFKIIFHDIIENYKLIYLLKNFYKYEYKNINEIKFCQFALCKLKNTVELDEYSAIKIFKKSIKSKIRYLINVIIVKLSMLIFIFYNYGSKIGIKTNPLQKILNKIL